MMMILKLIKRLIVLYTHASPFIYVLKKALVLLRLLVLVDERLNGRWQLGHELLEPGLKKVVAVVHGLIDGLLVHQVNLWHNENAYQDQDEQRERVENTAHAIQEVEEEKRKARCENVVPENDRLGLVDQLVDVSLEPVRKL